MSDHFTMQGYLSNISLWKSVVWVFESFYWWMRVLFPSAVHFSMTSVNELKNGSCILERNVLAGSEVLSAWKGTKRYTWPVFLKCTSRLAVAQTQENAGCWQTLSLPPDTRTHRHENNQFTYLFYLHFWRNNFIIGVIQSAWSWSITPNA